MYKVIEKSLPKKEAEGFLTGMPAYTDDIAPSDCLIVKLLRSPHANAYIEEIDTEEALKTEGVSAVFTWKDIDQDMPRFTNAGQAYPEPSAHDRLLLDRHVRYAGDVVAVVAAKTEKAADKALKKIKVKYEILDAVFDYHKALDNKAIVHPERTWEMAGDKSGDNMRNLVSHAEVSEGGIEEVLDSCDIVLERTYHTKACSQTPMETFRTYCYMDIYGRLVVVSSTQIVFHARRHISKALGIPASKVRVIKPAVGGGFGAKQSSISEFYPALVTWKTGKPSKIIFSRKEAQTAGSPRHEMEVTVRLGANKDGRIRAISMYTLSNTGAYSEHGSTTVDLSGHKAISLYKDLESFSFEFDVVYTNRQPSGAYRGFGGTQGTYALETTVNELCDILDMDRFKLRSMNITYEGAYMPAYYGEYNTSCRLDDCLDKVKEMIKWDEKYPFKKLENGKIRAVGLGMCLQGSCITMVDVGEARLKLNDDGFFTLFNGAGEMGQGCDTVLAQIAAEVLDCPYENIVVRSGDTDVSPYDSGSYASSTTFVTGRAVKECAQILKDKIIEAGSLLLDCKKDEAVLEDNYVRHGNEKVHLSDIAYSVQQIGHEGYMLEASYHCTGPSSPPPYIAGACEIEVDPLTGEIKVIEYDACIDCGTVINPALARVQAEGGIMQGIGMSLFEDINYDLNGKVIEDSFMRYNIPSRLDTPVINIEFAPSYEENGPFGAKSIGEVVLNTPLSAITDAVYNATGIRFTELPILPEKVAMGIYERRKEKR